MVMNHLWGVRWRGNGGLVVWAWRILAGWHSLTPTHSINYSASLLKDWESDTNRKIEILEGASSINLRKLARSGRKFSSPGCTLEGNFVHVPVWYLSPVRLRRRNTD
jgi:hypothetical protein